MVPRSRWFVLRTFRFLVIGFIVLNLIFILPRVMPGDPIENIMGEGAFALTDEARDELMERYHLNDPLWDQYVGFIHSLMTMDFGYSISRAVDVSSLIKNRIMWTLALTLPSILIGSVLSIYAAVYCGTHRGSTVDKVLSVMSIHFQTMPNFLVAMVAILLFGIWLRWFPISHVSSGAYSGVMGIADVLYHMILPVSVLTSVIFFGKFLTLRSSVIQIMNENYIMVARSKGVPEDKIRERHIMRNIMPTFLSMLVMNVGFMISGALIIEMVFSLQGMGALIYQGISQQDYPVIQGVFLILISWVLLCNIVAEFLYGIVDPRVGDSLEGMKN